MKSQTITIRFILAVIAGLATSMALSMITRTVLYWCGVFPPPFKPMFETHLVIVALVYHTIYAMSGAFVTANLARDKAKKAVIFLGSKEAIMWLLGTLLLWKHSPAWYTITKAVIGIPVAMLGGWLYQVYRDRKNGEKLKDESISIKELFKLLIARFRKKKERAV